MYSCEVPILTSSGHAMEIFSHWQIAASDGQLSVPFPNGSAKTDDWAYRQEKKAITAMWKRFVMVLCIGIGYGVEPGF